MFESKFVKNLKPYKISSQKVWDIDDEDILKLDWNESTIPPSPEVSKRIAEFLNSGHLNWYPNLVNNQLIKSLADYTGLDKNKIQYFGSSDSIHEYLVKAYIEPGDRICIVGPTYDNFRVTAASAGAEVEYFFLDNNFNLDFDGFLDQINSMGIKIVYICSPNNPTNTVYGKDEIRYLLEKAQNTLFILDEAYVEFSGQPVSNLINEYKNLFITRTFSKAFGLASFRVGYLMSTEDNITFVNRIRNPKNITSFSQIAAIAALSDLDYMREYVKEVNLAKSTFSSKLIELGFKISGYKAGGNYILISAEDEERNELIDFLDRNNIFVRDYSHVAGMENYFRITIGTRVQMEVVLNKIKQYLGR